MNLLTHRQHLLELAIKSKNGTYSKHTGKTKKPLSLIRYLKNFRRQLSLSLGLRRNGDFQSF